MNPEYVEAAVARERAILAATISGRNNQLNKASFALGQFIGAGQLDRTRAEDTLLSACQENSYIAKAGIVRARATIKSGLDAGSRQPRSFPNGPSGSTRSAPRPIPETDTPAFPIVTAGAKFIPTDDPPHISDELPDRRHVYRRADQTVRVKIKRESGAFIDFYRVTQRETGEIGWQAKKPSGYVITPYVGAIDPFGGSTRSEIIFCAEGEKDADTLGRHGLPAFTFGGSSDVPEGCEEFVRGRDVVVLADNDEVGRRWAAKISNLFATTAATVRVIRFPELPEGEDVSDWFKRGGNVDALLERVAVATPVEGQAAPVQKLRLLVEPSSPDLTVAALRDILARAQIYDRGSPVRLVRDHAVGGVVAQPITPEGLVLLAHQLCRPHQWKMKNGELVDTDVRLPHYVAKMYLDWRGEWRLRLLNGVATTPLLHEDGSIHSHEGYDAEFGNVVRGVPGRCRSRSSAPNAR